ncbi:hypothetical protein Q644_25815 [Brucella intermedia 229E]|uniref:Uncharacterized protein n=1 Tax=Brucella intermedia 229E TaxID=1337887 RepID=U4VCT3_9HYPH|nr:hypothetical protein Q644_25815 [Brucella intermedia 229E]
MYRIFQHRRHDFHPTPRAMPESEHHHPLTKNFHPDGKTIQQLLQANLYHLNSS